MNEVASSNSESTQDASALSGNGSANIDNVAAASNKVN